MSKRTFFVGGNWKCNGMKESIKQLITDLNDAQVPSQLETVVCPPFVYLDFVSNMIRKDFKVGAQNCWSQEKGAWTGEVSPVMLKDLGLEWTILGHSERRQIHESDKLISEKVALALKNGIKVIFCLGESASDRQTGMERVEQVLSSQLGFLLDTVPTDQWSKIVVAYEPVWAIGTGLTATPEQAQTVHRFLRQEVTRRVNAQVAENLRIIYGGSVKADNATLLASQPDIDGFLVGGASLISKDFVAIMNSAVSKL